MTTTRSPRRRTLAGLAVVALASGAFVLDAQTPDAPPVILYNTSPKAIEYQISRLTNNELARVDRRVDQKYRPIYAAMLTRKGLGREYFEEALEALVKIDKTTRTRILLDTLARVAPDDPESADRLAALLASQPVETLRQQREMLDQAIAKGSSYVQRGAFAALLAAEPVDQVWKRGANNPELLKSIASLPAKAPARAALFDRIVALLKENPEPALRYAAVSAIPHTRTDATAFRLLAAELTSGSREIQTAAIGAILRLPAASLPAAEVEPVARTVVALMSKAAPIERTTPTGLEAMSLGEKLAAVMPGESAAAIRRDLRALGVQVVRIETIPEQMTFDVRWFAVEAGRPVQIVLYNPDAMSHNLLITKPGALKEVGTAAAAMSLPTDPRIKPYVPDSPLVLQSTRLLNWAETERLGFVAPKEPGEYPFVCTFPGHWVRMYGVMLVVPSLEAWEAKRTVPTDPMTGQPFPAQRQ